MCGNTRWANKDCDGLHIEYLDGGYWAFMPQFFQLVSMLVIFYNTMLGKKKV